MNAPPKFGADGESRPHNLLFTRQLLCHLSYISKYHWGRRTRTAGSECCSLSPERLCPNVYTIRIVKELSGATKNPGGNEPAGVFSWSFPGRFDVRAFREILLKGLGHRFPTIRGEHINTIKRHMRGYRAQA